MSESKEKVKEYSNGEVTVVWKPGLCIHSAKCVQGLPNVFDQHKRPWIDVSSADSEALINQVNHCPSGALSYFRNEDGPSSQESAAHSMKVELMKNGPLMVHGNIEIHHSDGSSSRKEKVTAFCRCGASANKPYCDGNHKKVGFEG